MRVLVPEQNIEVHQSIALLRKTLLVLRCFIKGRETNGKHKTFNVLPSDPSLRSAFLSPVSHSVSFYMSCLLFWFVFYFAFTWMELHIFIETIVIFLY